MSKCVWRSLALLAAAGVARLAWSDSLPLVGSYERRFHPETVIERDVEDLDQHIRNGKLVLNLKAFLALVLRNSTGIRLTQLDVYTAADAITSAKAPFDPQLLLQFNAQRSVQEEAAQTSGTETLSDLGQTSTASYSQVFGAGPAVTASFNAVRTSSNSPFNFFNPSIATGLNFTVTQPLLQNRGNLQIRAPLMVARTQFRIVTEQSQAQIATSDRQCGGAVLGGGSGAGKHPRARSSRWTWRKNRTSGTARRSNSGAFRSSTFCNRSRRWRSASSI